MSRVDSVSKPLDASLQHFREAMAAYPTGVTIVTTTDAEGMKQGFTATSFASLSLDPPLVLVSLARTAACHAAFEQAEAWAINVLTVSQSAHALRFATRGAAKFAEGDFSIGITGSPVLDDSAMVIECSAHAKPDGGDHTILIGRVERVVLSARPPVVYADRRFRGLAEPTDDRRPVDWAIPNDGESNSFGFL